MLSGVFSERLRGEADYIWERILAHPYLVEMGEGKLPLDKFRYYVKQDYAYLIDFARCLGLAAAKAEDKETMSTLASFVNSSLTIEVVMLERLGERLGIPLDQLRATEQAPTTKAYTRHLLCVAHSGTIGEVMAAMLPCMWTYQEIGERIGGKPALKGLPVYKEWCDTYRSQSYIDLVDWYRSLTDRSAAEAGASVRERMRSHFILSSRYEYMFWDMAYRKETWPI
jgi:thiaminase/transcriptional activator TenA